MSPFEVKFESIVWSNLNFSRCVIIFGYDGRICLPNYFICNNNNDDNNNNNNIRV